MSLPDLADYRKFVHNKEGALYVIEGGIDVNKCFKQLSFQCKCFGFKFHHQVNPPYHTKELLSFFYFEKMITII